MLLPLFLYPKIKRSMTLLKNRIYQNPIPLWLHNNNKKVQQKHKKQVHKREIDLVLLSPLMSSWSLKKKEMHPVILFKKQREYQRKKKVEKYQNILLDDLLNDKVVLLVENLQNRCQNNKNEYYI